MAEAASLLGDFYWPIVHAGWFDWRLIGYTSSPFDLVVVVLDGICSWVGLWVDVFFSVGELGEPACGLVRRGQPHDWWVAVLIGRLFWLANRFDLWF